MTELFYMGGPLFMGILTLLLLCMLALATYRGIQIARDDIKYESTFRHQLTHIKAVGLFALVFGIFSQLLGLYQAFSAIERAGDISPALLMGGLKVSMLSTIYGVIIFLISYLIWMALDYKMSGRAAAEES